MNQLRRCCRPSHHGSSTPDRPEEVIPARRHHDAPFRCQRPNGERNRLNAHRWDCGHAIGNRSQMDATTGLAASAASAGVPFAAASINCVMQSPRRFISSVPRPRGVAAATPRRRPDQSAGLGTSNGIGFLFDVNPAVARAASASAPLMDFAERSGSTMCVPVPPPTMPMPPRQGVRPGHGRLPPSAVHSLRRRAAAPPRNRPPLRQRHWSGDFPEPRGRFRPAAFWQTRRSAKACRRPACRAVSYWSCR